jgi:hypothetical protein
LLLSKFNLYRYTLAYLAAVEREHRLSQGVTSKTGKGAAKGGAGKAGGKGAAGAVVFPVMPSLIVAPLSTIRNWAAEAEKWVPGLNAVTYHGGGLYSQLTHILKAWRE